MGKRSEVLVPLEVRGHPGVLPVVPIGADPGWVPGFSRYCCQVSNRVVKAKHSFFQKLWFHSAGKKPARK